MSRNRTIRSVLTGLGVCALLLSVTGCGDDDDDIAAENAAAEPSSESPVEESDDGNGGESAAADVCAPLEEMESVTVADFASLSLGTYPIARAFGEFEKENIEINEETLAGTQDAIALLARGQIDVAQGSLSANLFSGIDQGFEVAAAASQGQMAGDELPSGFYVRTELIESGEVSTMEDLRGMKVGMPGTVGGAASYLAGLVLGTEGVTLDEVEVVSMTYPDMNAAFESAAIDAAFVGSPFNAVVEDDDNARLFGDQQAMANQTQAALLFGPNLLEDRPQVACAFLRANMRIAQDKLAGDYNDDPEVVQGFIDESGYTEEIVLATPEYYYDSELAFDPATFEAIQEMFIDVGVLDLDEPLPFETLVAEDLRQAAADSLDS